MGSKERARAAMAQAGVPIVPGGGATTLDEARATAQRLGYPLLVKATDGGGGKGMRLVRSEGELESALERTRSEAQKAFGSDEVYVERYLTGPATSRCRSSATPTARSCASRPDCSPSDGTRS